MRTFSRFSSGGSGHVVNGLNAHGGLYASLKSSTVVPSLRRSAVEESRGLVGLLPARPIAEDEIEPVRPRRHRPKANRLPVERELHHAFGREHLVVAQLIGNVDLLRASDP